MTLMHKTAEETEQAESRIAKVLGTAGSAAGGSALALTAGGLSEVPLLNAVLDYTPKPGDSEKAKKLLEQFPEVVHRSAWGPGPAYTPYDLRSVASGRADDNIVKKVLRKTLGLLAAPLTTKTGPSIYGGQMSPKILAHELGHHADYLKGGLDTLYNKHTMEELADPVKYPIAGMREWAAEVRANKNAVKILNKALGTVEAVKALPFFANQTFARVSQNMPVPLATGGALLGALLYANKDKLGGAENE